jgi:hypothetical protein
VILRIVTESVAKRLPAESTVMPNRRLNCAALPVPSACPLEPAAPASVVTTLVGDILRIAKL